MPEDKPEGARRSILNRAAVDAAIQIGCLLLLAYWTAIILRSFVVPVVWSVILVVLLNPIFEWIVSHLHIRRFAAAAFVTAVSLVVLLGPVSWLSISLATSVRSFAQRLASGNLSVPPPPQNVRNWPVLGDGVYDIWHLASSNLKAALIQIGPQLKSISGTLLGYAGSAGVGMLQFLLAVIISGFLLFAGPPLVSSVRSIIRRIATRRGDEFLDLAGATIRNLARGVIGISLLQALLAGIGLIIAGAPAPGLLSFLVLVFGIVQIGATPVLGPMVVWGWLTMDTTSALIFSLYMVPVGLLDNFLRPFVMAHGLKTPMLVILVGVIGGILAHGVIGLFIGPIVLAIAWELLIAWSAEGEHGVRAAPPGDVGTRPARR